MRKSWELTDEQKKEIDENTEKMLEEWKQKEAAGESTDSSDDEEIGARERERTQTKEDDENIR